MGVPSTDSLPVVRPAGSFRRFVRRLRYGRPVVIVSGLPRSGTSLMMQMLQAGGMEIVTDDLRTPDDNNPRGYFELEAVKDLDKGVPPAWLAGARGKAVKIVSSLLRFLPDTCDYQVILMQRDLDEVIASQNKMLTDRGTPPDASQNDRVKSLYQKHVDETLQLLVRRQCFSTLLVDHGDVIAQPAQIAHRVAGFLHAPLDVQRMATVTDPALYRNRSPKSEDLRSPR